MAEREVGTDRKRITPDKKGDHKVEDDKTPDPVPVKEDKKKN